MKYNRSSRDEYAELFLRYSETVEKWLLKAIIVFFILLLLSQTLLLHEGIRNQLSIVDRLEGIPAFFAPFTKPMVY